MKLVNAVFKARLPTPATPLNLEEIAKIIPRSKYYTSKPAQIRILSPPPAAAAAGGAPRAKTCLIFARGGLRVMGGHLTSVKSAKKYLRRILRQFTKSGPVEVTCRQSQQHTAYRVII